MTSSQKRTAAFLKKQFCPFFFALHLLLANLAASQSPHVHPRSVNTPTRHLQAARLINLGAAYMNQQQFQRALSLFRQAAALDPKLEIAKVNQGIALVNLQKYELARTILNNVLQLNPQNAHAWYTLALMYKNQSQPEKALDAFQAAARLEPDDP